MSSIKLMKYNINSYFFELHQQLELLKWATRSTSGQPMTGSGFNGPGPKGPEDKRAQKYLSKPGPLWDTDFRASPIT